MKYTITHSIELENNKKNFYVIIRGDQTQEIKGTINTTEPEIEAYVDNLLECIAEQEARDKKMEEALLIEEEDG